jgi:hypothetical protein
VLDLTLSDAVVEALERFWAAHSEAHRRPTNGMPVLPVFCRLLPLPKASSAKQPKTLKR